MYVIKRTLSIPVSSKERDYLIRLLRKQQHYMLRVAAARVETNRPEWVKEARDEAEAAGAMAVRIASTVKRKPVCTS